MIQKQANYDLALVTELASKIPVTTATNEPRYLFLCIDFETWSPVNLPKTGANQYINHKDFTVLSAHVITFRGTDPVVLKRGMPSIIEPSLRYSRVSNLGLSTGNTPGITIDVDSSELFRNFYPQLLRDIAKANMPVALVAHNATFEMLILEKLFPELVERISLVIDTAVLTRTHGASSRLEQSAKQLLPSSFAKMTSGKAVINRLIKCSTLQEVDTVLHELNSTPSTTSGPTIWDEFLDYGDTDVLLASTLAQRFLRWEEKTTLSNHWKLTYEMNKTGWPVDQELVELFRALREKNEDDVQQSVLNSSFKDLNLRSPSQLINFFASRGVRLTSADEETLGRIQEKLFDAYIKLDYERIHRDLTPPEKVRFENIATCLAVCKLRKELGGAAVAKIDKIMDMTGPDGRLRDQYIHAGAGTTHRTSGAGVQLQNLKRLHDPFTEDEIVEVKTQQQTSSAPWSNTRLGENTRQLFGYPLEAGRSLVVADYSSIESRILAFLARAEWKLEAFREGKDPYKIQASHMYGVNYDDVTPEQRHAGKVGELGCGYQAGPPALMSFASGYGMDLSSIQARNIVKSWRELNPEVVNLWAELHDLLESVVASASVPNAPMVSLMRNIGGSMIVFRAWHEKAPPAILDIVPTAVNVVFAVSVIPEVSSATRPITFSRTFPGVYKHGRDFRYFKPREAQTGPVWTDHWVDPKTKQKKYTTLYGGKLTGILTQSLAREIFFSQLGTISTRLRKEVGGKKEGAPKIVGQLHDEIVIDTPTDAIPAVVRALSFIMNSDSFVQGLPLRASIEHAIRYKK